MFRNPWTRTAARSESASSFFGLSRQFASRFCNGRSNTQNLSVTNRKRLFETLELRQLLAGDTLMISEFLAVNGNSITDEDGLTSDWIELHNFGNESIDLAGYYLTDDLDDLTKWSFPSTTIAADSFEVIFASGKDQSVTGQEMHTNFRLSGGGEFLGLVMPDGETVISQYSPSFPEQLSDTSYGISDSALVETTLIPPSTSVSLLIPTVNQASDWTTPEFVPGPEWTTGETGIGFPSSKPEPATYLFVGGGRFATQGHDAEVLDHLQRSIGPDNVTYASSATVSTADAEAVDAIIISSTVDSSDVRDKFDDLSQGILNWESTIVDDNEPGEFGVISSTGRQRNKSQLNITSPNHPLSAGFTGNVTIFDTPQIVTTGNGDLAPDAFTIAEVSSTGGQAGIYAIDAGGELLDGSSAAGARVMYFLGDTGFDALNNAGLELFDAAVTWLGSHSAGTDFSGIIGTDIADQMIGANSSVLVRVPFSGEEIGEPDSMTLRMKYNDGFVAYLNGTEIARRNAPGVIGEPLPHDASATTEQSGDQSVIAEEIDLAGSIDLLLPGEGNILAIQGLNLDSDNENFLISPELVISSVQSGVEQYYVTPTPGAENVIGAHGIVGDTQFSVDRGFYDEPIEVEISSSTVGAEIRYTLDGTVPGPRTGSIYRNAITINETTTLRAAAFKPGFLPTNIDTQTYVFLDDVLKQNNAGLPDNWGHSKTNLRIDACCGADYEVDPEVVENPIYSDNIRDDFLSLPTLSVVTDMDNLFGDGGQGIYINGAGVERPVSAELIFPDGTQGFQINAALQIQGGSSTNRWKSDKLSMRLKFKEEYGPTKLRFPLFGEDRADVFDTLILDASLNLAYTHPSDSQNTPTQLIRDQFVADVQNTMGGLAPEGKYVHLYLNGLYWGQYNIHERPDDAFTSIYMGGEREDWDIIKHRPSSAIRGTNANYNAMTAAGNRDMTVAANYDAIQQMLDIDDFIDYMIINFYVGNTDWAHQNWYASFNREDPDGRWRYHSWDAEHVLKSTTENVTSRDDGVGSPTRIHHSLSDNEEYRLLFADKLQKHFFNNGTLTPANAEEIYQKRLDEIDQSIVAESARWGDNRRVQPYTRDVEWVAERDRLLNDYFPRRTDIVLGQFRTQDLYPSIDAGQFEVNGSAQHGGQISSDDLLSIVGAGGRGTDVYYTTDGSDPRLPGGAISPNAIKYSDAITLPETTVVKVRVKLSSIWSSLTEAQFFVNTPASAVNLAISEINYNPTGPTDSETAAGVTDGDDFEFIELLNKSGDQTIDLGGVQFTNGIEFDFSNSDVSHLAPGEHIVVVSNQAAFETRYGSDATITGVYNGSLSNGGERITLLDRFGEMIMNFSYDDQGNWPGRADGTGSTLEIIDNDGNYNDSNNWRSSNEFNGSPGSEGTGPIHDVIINEVLSNSGEQLVDTIELLNTTSQNIDVSNWFLSDSNGNLRKLRIPAGSSIPAGGYLIFDENDFNASGGDPGVPSDFALSGNRGDDVWLVAADDAGNLTRFVDHVDFTAAESGVSFGRLPNGTGDLFPNVEPTFGSTNSSALLGDVIISEIMYHAPVNSQENPDLEFVEIYNTTDSSIDLTDWKIRKGIDFDFSPGTMIDAQSALVIISFDPDKPENAERLQQFHSTYGIDSSVSIVGGFDGRLSNDGERFQLLSSGEPPVEDPDLIPRIVSDQVRFDDVTPWPLAGNGESIHRLSVTSFTDDPTAWQDGDATPGSVPFAAGDPPPRVVQVLVSGSSWDADFPAAEGYAIPAGDTQLSPLPWSNIDTVHLVFSENVSIDQNDLSILGVNVSDYITEVGLLADGFNYDSASNTASWQLGGTINADKLQLSLSDSVQDDAGQSISDFEYHFNVLPGDGSQSGEVNNRDVQDIRTAILAVAGDAGYSQLLDFDGSSAIDIRDVQILRSSLLSTLPAGNPTRNLQFLNASLSISRAPQEQSGSSTAEAVDAAMAAAVERRHLREEESVEILLDTDSTDLLTESTHSEHQKDDRWQDAIDAGLEEAVDWLS